MLKLNPNERPSVREVLKHPFFKNKKLKTPDRVKSPSDFTNRLDDILALKKVKSE